MLALDRADRLSGASEAVHSLERGHEGRRRRAGLASSPAESGTVDDTTYLRMAVQSRGRKVFGDGDLP